MNKQTIDLDVITGGVPQVLHVSQYDTGARTLEFNIYASNNDLDLTGATAKISGKKPDGLGFEYPATISDGVVVADCTDQMTAVAGIVECAITLTNSEGQIQTARFDLNVKPAPLNDDTVISDSDFPLIQQAIGAEKDAEAWAVGTRNGEPVPVSDPTYENNSKYWAEQAAQTDVGHIREEIADIVNVYGSKNLLSYPYYETTKTHNGITFTDNGDGTVTANGTASGSSQFIACSNLENVLERGKKYILSGCIGGSNTTYFLYMDVYTTGFTKVVENFNGDTEFTMPNSGIVRLLLIVRNGATVSNLTFKPMIRLESVTDDTYVPYAMTNYELTQKIADLQAQINALI